MSVLDDLVPLLKKLRMSGLLQSLELRLRQAVDDNLSHEEFLYRLMSDEVERREAKQLHQRVRRASFEHQKTLEEFDFHFNPQLPKAKLIELGTCAFVERPTQQQPSQRQRGRCRCRRWVNVVEVSRVLRARPGERRDRS